MKKIFAIVLMFNCLIVIGQNKLNLVPMPAEVKIGKGDFTLSEKTRILIRTSYLSDNAKYLQDHIYQISGIKCSIKNVGTFGFLDSLNRKNIIRLNIPPKYSFGLAIPNGKYLLNVNAEGISIDAENLTGLFYGIQTLLQLFPGKKNNEPNSNNFQIFIPQLSIKDYPGFPYRGMHLDVGRHFFPISFVKKYIDYLATYKYNTFHWHLTEDQGWRIEIKKYPELIKTGGFRNGTIIGRYPGQGNDNKPYGGFYTQAEIKEVVKYAKERYIDVIPEIEMPGHSSAAIAAYPWLSCFPAKPTEIPEKMISQKSIAEQKAGRIKLVQETWGVFDDVFCAGKDSTFTFLQNVIDEVNALFPSKYFHLGADECPKAHWKLCPACQKRMKDNNLKDEHELQSWFVQRIEKYLNSKGKTLIGWDEILEGGLAPNAVVMSWRGEAGGIEAAKQKHKVIMTPGNPVYFDHSQSKNEDSVTIGGYNSLEAVYAYEPIPKELNAEEGKYVLGAQANMWTEYMQNTRKIEYMMFPRMAALSEVLWSPKEKRDWKDFERRLPIVFERLDKQKINYSKAYYDLKATVMPTENYNGVIWDLVKKKNNSQPIIVKYELIIDSALSAQTLFDSLGNAVKYKIGTKVPQTSVYRNEIAKININNTGFYKALIPGPGNYSYEGQYDEKNPVSILGQKFSFNKATGKKITLVTQPGKSYPGDGAFTLVNGVQNDKGLAKSSEFLGFLGKDLDATIDLGKETEVSKIVLHTLYQPGSWIYLPGQIDVSFIPFIDTTIITKHQPIEMLTHVVKDENNDQAIKLPEPKTCRYIRVFAKNYGIIPAGKPGAGNPAWLFVDEIEVQ